MGNKKTFHKTSRGFVAGINNWSSLICPAAAAATVRQVYMACFQGIITQSPVDNGTFRLSWFPAIGEPTTRVATKQTGSKGESYEADRMEPIPAFHLGDVIVIGNALPYAKPIESGWSPKAPQGVVAPTKRAVEIAMGGLV